MAVLVCPDFCRRLHNSSVVPTGDLWTCDLGEKGQGNEKERPEPEGLLTSRAEEDLAAPICHHGARATSTNDGHGAHCGSLLSLLVVDLRCVLHAGPGVSNNLRT